MAQSKNMYRYKDWLKRNDMMEYASDTLYDMFVTNYLNLEHSKKMFFAQYLKEHECTFNYDLFIDFCSKKISENAKKGYCNYLKKHNKTEINKRYSKSIKKGIQTRIDRMLEKYPNLDINSAKQQVYLNALITKGKKIAHELDLNVTNEAELLKLSGYQKKLNFSKLSMSEKEEKKLKWMRSNLLNINVQNTLLSEYPNIKFDIHNMTDDSVKRMFADYTSIKSSKMIIDGIVKGYGISGHMMHNKSNKILFYRSSYEKTALQYLEYFDNINKIDTEPYHIMYINDIGIKRRYVPDIQLISSTGMELLIEIKPLYKVQEFLDTKYKFLSELDKNKIIIITEEELKNYITFYEKINKYFKDNGTNSNVI